MRVLFYLLVALALVFFSTNLFAQTQDINILAERVGAACEGNGSPDFNNCRAYFWFDLSGVNRNWNIIHADLNIFGLVDGDDDDYQLQWQTDCSWASSDFKASLAYNAALSDDNLVIVSSGWTSNNDWDLIDVTSQVQESLFYSFNKTDYCVMLVDPDANFALGSPDLGVFGTGDTTYQNNDFQELSDKVLPVLQITAEYAGCPTDNNVVTTDVEVFNVTTPGKKCFVSDVGNDGVIIHNGSGLVKDVAIDCNGMHLIGNDFGKAWDLNNNCGPCGTGVSNIIQNCVVEDYNVAFYANVSDFSKGLVGTTFYNNFILGINGIGIDLEDSVDLNFSDNNFFTDSVSWGHIILRPSSWSPGFYNNFFDGSATPFYGVFLDVNSSKADFYNNVINRFSTVGVYFKGTGLDFNDNNLNSVDSANYLFYMNTLSDVRPADPESDSGNVVSIVDSNFYGSAFEYSLYFNDIIPYSTSFNSVYISNSTVSGFSKVGNGTNGALFLSDVNDFNIVNTVFDNVASMGVDVSSVNVYSYGEIRDSVISGNGSGLTSFGLNVNDANVVLWNVVIDNVLSDVSDVVIKDKSNDFSSVSSVFSYSSDFNKDAVFVATSTSEFPFLKYFWYLDVNIFRSDTNELVSSGTIVIDTNQGVNVYTGNFVNGMLEDGPIIVLDVNDSVLNPDFNANDYNFYVYGYSLPSGCDSVTQLFSTVGVDTNVQISVSCPADVLAPVTRWDGNVTVWTTSWSGNQTGVEGLGLYDGNLFAGTGNNGKNYTTNGVGSWVEIYDSSEQYFESFASFDGNLFAGSHSLGKIQTYDGSNWSTVYDHSGAHSYGMGLYDSNLYVGTDDGGKIFTLDSLGHWSVGYDSVAYDIWDFVEYNGNLWVGSGWSKGYIFKFDGTTWSIGYDSPASAVKSLEVFDGNLFAGTDNSGIIYTFDGSNWSVSFDSDSGDIRALKVFDGNLFASSGDSGKIYSFDGTTWSEFYDTGESSVVELEVFDANLMVGTVSQDVVYSYGVVKNYVYSNDVNIHLTCKDGQTGCALTQYRLDTDSSDNVSYGSWMTYDSNIFVSGDGNWAIDFNSSDFAGNIEQTHTYFVNILIPKIPTIDINNSPMVFNIDNNAIDENGDKNIPFLLINKSSGDIDVSACANFIPWSGTVGGTDLNHFRFISDENETGSCGSIESSSWLDFNYIGSGKKSGGICESFSSIIGSNKINVGISIKAPDDEPTSTSVDVNVVFYFANDTTSENDSIVECA